MAVHPKLPWDLHVPLKLQSGTLLSRWEEETISSSYYRVDKYGFFLAWRAQDDKEGSCIELSNISEVRCGGLPKDPKLQECLQGTGLDPLEERTFTIAYNTNLVDVSFLHICANTTSVATEWVEGLKPLLHNVRMDNCSILIQLHKQYVKAGLHTNAAGNIPVKSICKSLNAGKFEHLVLDALQALELPCLKHDEIKPDDLSFEQFYQLYLKICPRLEIMELCVKWGGGRAPILTSNQLVNFLNQEQRDPRLNEILYPFFDKEKALAIIQKYEKAQDMLQRDRISVNGLTRYLLSEDSLLIMPNRLELYQDMNQPLSHYFISSSHNTYLVGRQFGGRSSVEMYRQCLLAGCRCIELDCWDGPGDEPIITHGNAMCSKVLFKDVIEAIRDSAFVTSDSPVLLSFENHCSKYQQCRMACYCMELLGEKLVTKPLEFCPLEEGRSLPSPNQLRGRILIKNKKLKPEQEADGESSFYDFSDFESVSSVSQRVNGSIKETIIVDDDIEEEEERKEEKEEDDLDFSKFMMEDKSLSPKDLKNIWQYSNKVTSDILENAATMVTLEDIKQYGSVSEYSSYLLSKVLGDAGLNGLEKDLEQGLHSSLRKGTVSNWDKCPVSVDKNNESSSECDCDSEDVTCTSFCSKTPCRTCEMIKSGNRLSGTSLTSNGSTDSDFSSGSSDSQSLQTPTVTVTPIGETHYNFRVEENEDELTPTPTPNLTPTPSPTPTPNTTPTKEYKPNRGLSSIREVSDTCEMNGSADLKNNNFNFQATEKSKIAMRKSNGNRAEDNTSSGFNGTYISNGSEDSQTNERRKDSNASEPSQLPGRKESNASTQSTDSNGDEEEERDYVYVVPFRGKREPDKTFGSSLRRNMVYKKGSRAASLTPDDLADLTSFSQSTTGNINPLLSSLVNYIQPVPFQGFDESEKRNLSYQMSSFNESTGFGLVRASPLDFVKYNKRQMSRIYPKGSRVDSSNYMPQVFWNVGCQMVALNFQTPDLAFHLNQGKFEYNRRCGYILKPDLMRRADRVFDPFTESPIDGYVAAYVAVKVISGQYLSDKKISTLVEVDMYGLPTDTVRKKYKTKMVTSNGLNTVYDEDEMVFRRVVLPELALLRFAVLDDNDRIIAQRAVPLDGLQAGYRHVPLRTEYNNPIPLATLFVHITLRSYVPEGYGAIVDELSEPMKYQSAADKRAAQMVVFGIDETDDDLPDFVKKSSSHNALAKMKYSSTSLTSLNSLTSGTVSQYNTRSRDSVVTLGYMGPRAGSELALQLLESNLPKKNESKFTPISLEELKKDKTFRKTFKRQQKEMETSQKKDSKERVTMQRSHTSELEKLITSYEEIKFAAQKTFERAVKRSGGERALAIKAVYDKKSAYLSQSQREKAHEILSSQTEEWTNMINRHTQEEVTVYEQHAETQICVLKSALDGVHESQIKETVSKHEREINEIKKKQTKQSIEAGKALAMDKTIKSKEEKERKQRELDRQNLKQFVDERQKLSDRQEREVDELKNRHKEEKQELEVEIRKRNGEHREEIKANGDKLRKAIQSPYQTLLPAH